MDRREFLAHSASSAATAALAATLLQTTQARAAANDRVVICMAGVKGRGGSVLKTFAALPQVEVKYVCDIDEGVLNSRSGEVSSLTGRRPEPIKDFRQALEDKEVNALV